MDQRVDDQARGKNGDRGHERQHVHVHGLGYPFSSRASRINVRTGPPASDAQRR